MKTNPQESGDSLAVRASDLEEAVAELKLDSETFGNALLAETTARHDGDIKLDSKIDTQIANLQFQIDTLKALVSKLTS